MTSKFGAAVAAILMIVCSGCASELKSPLPRGTAAYEAIPVKAMDELLAQRIGAGDRLNIRVFAEPELSSPDYRVDASGFLQMPLVGQIIAAGVSPDELRQEISRRLAARFIRDPQVSVAVAERARASYAVEGEVKEPGIFEADLSTTLLAALAKAKSPTPVARLDEILVFREIAGKRVGARFDLKEIRSGRAADPQIVGGDTIVVGYSSTKGAFRDFVLTAPLLNLFYIFK